MGKSGVTIHTGVDGLVSLVHDKERVSFRDAAKLLSVPLNTIEEWAHFLAEERVIDVEYNLRNPVLVKIALTPEQKTKLKHDFETDRNIFHNRLTAVTSYFDELDKQIVRVNKIVEDLDAHLETQVDDIKDELSVLHTLETQKNSLHEQMLESKKRVDAKLHEIDKHLAEERIRYKQYEAQERQALQNEAHLFTEANAYLSRVRKDEQELEKKLQEVKKFAADIEKSILVYSKGVTEGEKRIELIKLKHDKLVKDLEQEYVLINDLIKKNQDTEKAYAQRIEDVMQRIKNHETVLQKKTKTVQDLPSSIQDLIKNKEKIHEMISSIKHDEVEIQQELHKLHEKSKVIEFKIGTPEYQKFLAETNAAIDELSKKRSGFEEKIQKLISLITLKK